MALRVLLADESSTIKKVFQLALQDFAVEVKPVNIGLDVIPVAQNFQPDIIFADVLLQKKSGYEVSAEVKGDSQLSQVPVVLMWSGFMELDEDKYQASLANGRLEKPFDVGTLRKLVTDLVPKTQSQRLSQFLTFPKMPEMENLAAQQAAAAAAPKPAPEEEFHQVSIPKMKSGADRFRIPVPTDEDADMPVSLKMPNEPIDVKSLLNDGDEPEEFTVMSKPAAGATKPMPPPKMATAPNPMTAAPKSASPPIAGAQSHPLAGARPPSVAPPIPMATSGTSPFPITEPIAIQTPALPTLSEADLERIVRSQTQEIIEAVVWKVLPDLAQQIIEREIQKILKEKDGSLYR